MSNPNISAGTSVSNQQLAQTTPQSETSNTGEDEGIVVMTETETHSGIKVNLLKRKIQLSLTRK